MKKNPLYLQVLDPVGWWTGNNSLSKAGLIYIGLVTYVACDYWIHVILLSGYVIPSVYTDIDILSVRVVLSRRVFP